MSQFDQTTEKKAEMASNHAGRRLSYKMGRNSTKASMEILARAIERLVPEMQVFLDVSQKIHFPEARDAQAYAQSAIAQVKANGDWPLEEK